MRKKGIYGILASLLMMAFLIYGCGDDDKPPGPGPEPPTDPDSTFSELTVTLDEMIEAMATDPETPLDNFDFSALNQAFKNYESAYPGHDMASFGAAITSLLMLTTSEDLNALIDTIIAMDEAGMLKICVPNPEKMSGRGNFFAFPTEITATGVEPNFLAQSYVALMARAISNPPQFSEVQAIVRNEFLPAVAEAIRYINKIDPDFVFWVTPDMMGETSDSVEIDNSDFLAFGAGLSVIEAFLHMAVAYDIDIPSYDSAGLAYMFDQSNDWMSLHGDGGAQMSSARNSFLAAIIKADNALNSLEDEQLTDLNQSDDLIKASWTPSEYVLAHDALDSVVTYMSGPQTVYADFDGDGFDESVRIDASEIFNDPIDGIFSYLPPYSSEVTREYDSLYYYDWYWDEFVLYDVREYFVVNITWNADTFAGWVFPDPSFNGLLPDINSDTELKNLFGLTPDMWTKEMRIELPD